MLSYSQLFVGGIGGLGSNSNGMNGVGDHSYSHHSYSNGFEDDGFADPPGFRGAMQQLSMNGRHLFRLAASGQLTNHALNAVLVDTLAEETVHHAASFASQGTYLGLPQMKAYNSIDLGFQFRTFEANGLLMYNAGKASDFIAVELINGKLHYTLNLG